MNDFFIGSEKEELDRFIIGRVSPRIYVFKTGQVPDSLKVGDTYRPISERMEEWSRIYTEMYGQKDYSAQVGNKFFRDYSVHRYLKNVLKKYNLKENDFSGAYYSKEFFRDTEAEEVEFAVKVISDDIVSDGNHYPSYSLSSHEETISISGPFEPRDIQQEVIDKYVDVTENGTQKKELLLYAVMRFGKSFTAMCCAQKTQAKVVVVMSGKTDVRREWLNSVSYTANFRDEYSFIDAKTIRKSAHEDIDSILASGKKVVIFLSLQDSSNKNAISKYSSLFSEHIDLLIIDETHFGARAKTFGRAIYGPEENDGDDLSTEEARKAASYFTDVTVKLHLSGTPYRILAKDEFSENNIIGFYQYTDLLDKQKAWIEDNLKKAEPEEEWKNPYFGFPQMLRFAFCPNKASRDRIQALSRNGESCSFGTMFRTKSIDKTVNGLHKVFIYSEEILDLLQIIDGTKQERGLLGFLNYPKIVDGRMCRHIVFVLPWKASCDALEELINNNLDILPRLNKYKIINISGLDSHYIYPSAGSVVSKIKEYEDNDKKTITLTVGRMLTGSTVPYWDTMIYLKDTTTPEEYDQAVFRLQSPYVTEYKADDGSIIKYDMKPQTLLVDFDPNRMFRLQAYKSEIYNVNIDERGGNEWVKRISKELKLSPIIRFNIDKIHEVNALNIVDVIRHYSSEKGIAETAQSIDIDRGLLQDPDFLNIIKDFTAINSKKGIGNTPLSQDEEGNVIIIPGATNEHIENNGKKISPDHATPTDSKQQKTDMKELEEKMRCYIAKILFFSFLFSEPLQSLSDIITKIHLTDEGKRIAFHLGLKTEDLELFLYKANGFKINALDVQIMNQNQLSKDEQKTPIERAKTAINRFGKISDAEVVTPKTVVEEMIGLLPVKCIRNTISYGGKILDIASKMGEFAVALVQKAESEGIEVGLIKDSIYSIPTSGIAYEFTRYVYESLGLDVSCISHFTSFDLINHYYGNAINQDVVITLTQDKPFDKIRLYDKVTKGDGKMKFGVVVGNPPYQSYKAKTSDESIFYKFMDLGYAISPVCCFISPGKFLFNSGKTPKSWNKKMLNDSHLKVAHYFFEAKDVFEGVGFEGGVAITYRDILANFGTIGTFIAFPQLESIIKKVSFRESCALSTILFAPESYNFSNEIHSDYPFLVNRFSRGHKYDLTTNIFSKISELSFETMPNNINDYLKIVGLNNKKRTARWIRTKYIRPHNNLECFKVFVPKSNGSDSIRYGEKTQVIGDLLIAEPFVGHTQSFISIGAFQTIDEAIALSKYIKSKFVRALIGSLKVTQDNKKKVWSNVPLQDFTRSSDIDWSKSISCIDLKSKEIYGFDVNEIDSQLYEKYCLTKDEVAFIESTIKSMDGKTCISRARTEDSFLSL